ncbi:MAG: hypothetical protein AAF750_10040 [Planctomycetota bacterium]
MIGYLVFAERGRGVRVGLSDGLVWEGEDTAYVRLLAAVCPAPEESIALLDDPEGCGRHMLYNAAGRLGARVVIAHDRQLAPA